MVWIVMPLLITYQTLKLDEQGRQFVGGLGLATPGGSTACDHVL